MRPTRPIIFRKGATRVTATILEFATGTLVETAGVAVYTPPGGGGGAPTDAQYLTLTTNATLTQERTLSLTLPLSGSDGGAGAAYTVTLSGWSGTTDGDMLYRNGTAVGSKTPAQARTWLDLATYYQPLDADLTAYAALATTGIVVRTGAGTAATATVSTPLTLTGSTLAVSAASTSAAGVVELATDGEAIADRAVQGNDSRLGTPGAANLGLGVLCGFGAGGDLTLDGSAAVGWGTWSTIGGIRTLTVTAAAVIEYDVITFDFTTYSSIAIVSKGARLVFRSVAAVGTGTGYIDWNGGNASGSTAGLGAAAVSTAAPYAGGQNGATGRNTSGSGATPSAYNQGVSLGGIGGAGGAAGGTSGGNAGSLTRNYQPGYSTYGGLADFILLAFARNWASGTSQNQYQLSGGAGGAAGGCQITATSGGGGGGAGVVGVCIGKLNMGANTLYIRAIGGVGGTAVATSGGGTAGGGGGGAGGALLVAIGNAVSACVLSADGGSGGPGATVDADIGAGGAGGDGGLVACIYGAGSVPTGTATGGMGGTGSNGVNAAQGAAGTVYIVSANI